MIQQQSNGENRRGWIGDALAGYVGSRSVGRLEHRWKTAVWVDIAARGQADSSGNRCCKISQDVSKEVVGDDDIEARRIGNEKDRGGVDMLAREMPDAWLDEIVVAGTPEQCLAAIDRLGEAGVARVALVPPADATIADLTTWCGDLAAAVR